MKTISSKHFLALLFCLISLTKAKASKDHYSDTITWEYPFSDVLNSEISFICNVKATSLKIKVREKMAFDNESKQYHFISGKILLIDDSVDSEIDNQKKLSVNVTPKNIKIQEVAGIIKSNNALFYTKAATSVPSITPLKTSLGICEIDTEHKFLEPAKMLVSNSTNYREILHGFFEKYKYSRPKPSHKSLARISRNPILTENIDSLQQKTRDCHLTRSEFKTSQKERKDLLINADYLITTGLQSDKKRILKRYKKINQKGLINSYNPELKQEYIGKLDFMVIGGYPKNNPMARGYNMQPLRINNLS